MSLKETLIKLGSTNPELRHHLRPILAALPKNWDGQMRNPDNLEVFRDLMSVNNVALMGNLGLDTKRYDEIEKVEAELHEFVAMSPAKFRDWQHAIKSFVGTKAFNDVVTDLGLTVKDAGKKQAADDVKEIVDTMLNQLTRSQQGARRLAAMIGAKNFLYDDKDENVSVTFRHAAGGDHAKLGKNAGITKITYGRGSDLYTVEFLTPRGNPIKEIDGVYGDQLKKVFESYTGLYLSI